MDNIIIARKTHQWHKNLIIQLYNLIFNEEKSVISPISIDILGYSIYYNSLRPGAELKGLLTPKDKVSSQQISWFPDKIRTLVITDIFLCNPEAVRTFNDL